MKVILGNVDVENGIQNSIVRTIENCTINFEISLRENCIVMYEKIKGLDHVITRV